MHRHIGKILIFVSFFIILFWISFVDEIYYYNTTKYSMYTIQIELLSGTKDTIQIKQPTGIHFQINCHSHKGNFNGCALEATPKKGELFNFLGGHWHNIRDGVINYKIINKKCI